MNDTKISTLAVNQNETESDINTTFNNTMIANTTFVYNEDGLNPNKQRSNSTSKANESEKSDLNSINIQDLVNFENKLKEN